MLEWYACIVNVQANDTEGIIKWRNIKQIVQFSRDFKRNLNDAVIPYTCNIIQFLITKSTLNMRWFIWIIWKFLWRENNLNKVNTWELKKKEMKLFYSCTDNCNDI